MRRPVAIGMLPGDPEKDIFARMRKYNVKVDSVLLYQNANYISWDYVKSNLDAGLQVQLVIEFFDSYPNLWDIAGGRYDSKLRDFFYKVKADGRRLTVRLLHEFNSDWYIWGIHSGGSNSLEAYLAAFRRISGVIRSTGANVRIQQAYNSLTSSNDQRSLASMYVGDAFCDEIAVSAYNFCGVSGRGSRNQGIAEIIAPWYNSMLTVTNKPLVIGEMSSTSNCGQKEQWIRDTFNTLAYQFPRITTVNWFLKNDWSIQESLDLNDWPQITAFRDGLNAFKWATGYALGDAVSAVTPSQEQAAAAASALYEKELKARGLQVSTMPGAESFAQKAALSAAHAATPVKHAKHSSKKNAKGAAAGDAWGGDMDQQPAMDATDQAGDQDSEVGADSDYDGN